MKKYLVGVGAAIVAAALWIGHGLEEAGPAISHGAGTLGHDAGTIGHGGEGLQTGLKAAGAAIKELKQGNSTDQAVARATCVLLGAQISGSPAQLTWIQMINAQLTPDERALPGVQAVVSNVATRLVGLTDYYSLYVDVCIAKH